MTSLRPLSTPERRAIHDFLGGAHDLDDAVVRTVKLLSQLTHQVAVVQYPSLQRSSVRHIEVVGLTPRRILVVVISDTGRVDQRLVELEQDLSEEAITEVRDLVNGPARIGRSTRFRRLIDLPARAHPDARQAAAA